MLDKVPILLAEDDENDVFLMNRAFSKAGFLNPIFVVHDGQETLDFLEAKGNYAIREKFPLPGLLLLDLKMPLLDGFDVLAWLRQRREFDKLPVVVLSSSKLGSDVDRSRELGVYDYRVKPQQFEDLVRLLQDVRQCWLDERFNHFAA
jgi:CheY-like chemotaxis protein